MSEIVDEWCIRIKEWMLSNQTVYTAGLANLTDGAVFAAASIEGDPVDQIYKIPYEAALPQEDGTSKMTLINEPECIKFAAENLRAPTGLWIGGQRYKVVRSEEFCDQGKFTFKTLFCVKPKGGCYLIVTPGNLILIAIYNEEKGQQSVNAKMTALAFAEYLAEHNY